MTDIILIPTYNEKENIKLIVAEISNILPAVKILVIDDNSPDGTATAVKFLMEKYSNLSLLERQHKTGLGDAYKDAISKVVKDKEIRSIITMDADGSHSPEYIKEFLNHIDNYDLIIGSRYVAGGGVSAWNFWRRLLSKFGNLYVRMLVASEINDLTAGFICVRREILERIDFNSIDSSGYAYQIEFKCHCLYALGAKIKEIPIIFKSRRGGESKISNQIISEGILAPWRILFKRIWKK